MRKKDIYIKELQLNNEKLQIQLAGCGVASLQNTNESTKERVKEGDYGWSASYADVCRAIDREMKLYVENKRLREIIAKHIPSVCLPKTLCKPN